MEIEKKLNREEAVTMLRKLADALEAADGTFDLENEKIKLPAEMDIELEYELDGGKCELEIELKWNKLPKIKKTGKFVVFQGKDEQWYFHLKAPNGEIILASKAFSSREEAQKGCDSVKANAREENIVYRLSKIGQHNFVLKSPKNEVLGMSQMYKRKVGARKGAMSVLKNAEEALA